MDPYSYVISSRIRGLAVPVGKIKEFTFQQYLHRLQSASEVRLLDVSPDTSPEHFLFNPQGYPNGRMCFSFESFPLDAELTPLFDLEPWRQQLLVVGIAQHDNVTNDELEQSIKKLRKQYPHSIYYKVLVFGVQDKEQEQSYNLPGVQPIASSSFASLERAMADIASEVLCEMSVFAISRKMGSFKSPALKALDEPSASLQAAEGVKGHHARNSSLGLTKNGTFSSGLTERLKARQQGRTKKFMGSFYLLSGRLPDALTELAEAAQILKQSYDHLWFASALEQIGVCLLLQQFSEVPVTIPSIAKVAVDADSSGKTARLAAKSAAKAAAAAKTVSMNISSPKNGLSSQDHLASEKVAEALQTGRMALATFLPLLMDTVVRFYNRCSPESEDMVPQVVYLDTALRFTNMLTALRLGGGWNPASLSAIVRNTPLERNITKDGPSLLLIDHWCSFVLGPSLVNMPLAAACRVTATLAKIYWRLNLKRKWSFVIYQLIQRLQEATEKDSADFQSILSDLDPSVLEAMLETIVPVFEWTELRIEFLRNFYTFAVKAKYTSTAVKAAWQLLHSGTETIDASEQTQLYHLIRTERDATPNAYWDPYLLRDISVKSVANANATSAAVSKRASVASGMPDIIYNPFESQEKSEDAATLVAGERSMISVRLQNPFRFSLDIFELVLVDTDGNKISPVEPALTLSPNKVSTVQIALTPTEAGKITIGGIYAHVGGCAGEVFWLRERATALTVSRQKQALEIPKDQRHSIKIQVNEGRPTLVLCNNTLPKGWAMLLEGEKVPFSVEVQNVSKTTAQVSSFGFTDSTVEPLKQAIASADATRADIYEYEYFLHRRRAVELLSQASEIAGEQKSSFDFTLYGKRGTNSAAILLDYGADDQFSRRLRIPLNVTVFPSVELERVDVLSVGLPGISTEMTAVLDLRNAWRQSLEVSLWSVDDANGEVARVTQVIETQKSCRFLLPLKWSGLSPEQLLQPIPSLSSRQFVVDSKTTTEQTQAFWLREELLKRLNGKWQMVDVEGESRSGDVEFRGLQLSKKMVSVLRTEPLLVKMSLAGPAPAVESRTVIQTKIVNKTSKRKYGMLRLIPDDTTNVLWNGNLQQPVLIEPDSEQTVDLEILPLAWGSYEWTAIYDVIGGGQAILKTPFVLEVPSALPSALCTV